MKICDYGENLQKKIKNRWLSWMRIPTFAPSLEKMKLIIPYFSVCALACQFLCPRDPDFTFLDSILPDWIQVLDDPYSDLYYEPKIFIQGTIRNPSKLESKA